MKIEVSNGDIIDKLTIMQIKLERINDKAKLTNLQKEYDELIKPHHQLLTLILYIRLCMRLIVSYGILKTISVTWKEIRLWR